jgi:hypothetical protein
MRKTTRTVGAVLAGLAVTGGTITGIAATSGGTTSPSGTATAPAVPAHPDGRGPFGHGGPSVHEESVQLNKAGTAFITVTSDQGTVKSVSGGTLTIHEGTTKVAYKDVAITVASSATIMLDGKTVALSGLAVGDRVRVSQSTDGTSVMAFDKNATGPGPGFGHRGGHDGGGWNGYGPGNGAPPAPSSTSSSSSSSSSS